MTNNMGVLCCVGGIALVLKIAAVQHGKSEISFDEYKDLRQMVSIQPELQVKVMERLAIDNKITYEALGQLENTAEMLKRNKFKQEFRTDVAKSKTTSGFSQAIFRPGAI